MRKLLTFILVIFSITSCKPKVLSGAELDNKLKETMSNYLDSTSRPGAHFEVKDVVYFTDSIKKEYICEFKVLMKYPNGDTTGTVAATITNDFKTVKRKQ